MKKFSLLKAAFMVFVFCAATAVVSQGQVTVTTLVSFNGANGNAPDMVLAQGADGNFYGTTVQGGANNTCTGGCGTVFKMAPTGTLTTLYNFCSQANCADGGYPKGSLIQAADGDFYGTAETGGAHGGGTVFKITPRGTLTTIYSFCALSNCADGESPGAGLVQATDGNLYGSARFGGLNGGGVVFEITSAGKLKTIYSFCALDECADGSLPAGVLIQATNGNLYGETEDGGINYQGTLFEITRAGKLTTLYSFCALFDCTDGSAPYGGLVQAASGDLYGTTLEGGSHCDADAGCGTVFKIKIDSAGTLTTLYNFCAVGFCVDGRQPRGGLVQSTSGNFYGTTYYGGSNGSCFAGCGTVFGITPGGILSTLNSFCSLPNCADGVWPTAGLLQATNGMFYGSTSMAGSGGDGTIFSLATGLGPFVKTQPTSADEGATIGIFGQGFNRSSVVQFGGVQATSIRAVQPTFLEAKVPAGALTGSVTVTTNGTTLTSNQQFRVTPQVLNFSPPNGQVGTQVTINGTGLTQTTGVGFGDKIPAQFTVNSDTQITATVPSGAKTGKIGVVTKGGTGISSKTFTVN